MHIPSINLIFDAVPPHTSPLLHLYTQHFHTSIWWGINQCSCANQIEWYLLDDMKKMSEFNYDWKTICQFCITQEQFMFYLPALKGDTPETHDSWPKCVSVILHYLKCLAKFCNFCSFYFNINGCTVECKSVHTFRTKLKTVYSNKTLLQVTKCSNNEW